MRPKNGNAIEVAEFPAEYGATNGETYECPSSPFDVRGITMRRIIYVAGPMAKPPIILPQLSFYMAVHYPQSWETWVDVDKLPRSP